MSNRYQNNNKLSELVVDDPSIIRYKYATSDLYTRIYNACENGQISFKEYVFKHNDRLDHIAGLVYGNGLEWWILAAASGISWWLQINAGTIIRIPKREDIFTNFNI